MQQEMTPSPSRQWNKEGAERPMMLEAVGAQEGWGGCYLKRWHEGESFLDRGAEEGGVGSN